MASLGHIIREDHLPRPVLRPPKNVILKKELPNIESDSSDILGSLMGLVSKSVNFLDNPLATFGKDPRTFDFQAAINSFHDGFLNKFGDPEQSDDNFVRGLCYDYGIFLISRYSILRDAPAYEDRFSEKLDNIESYLERLIILEVKNPDLSEEVWADIYTHDETCQRTINMLFSAAESLAERNHHKRLDYVIKKHCLVEVPTIIGPLYSFSYYKDALDTLKERICDVADSAAGVIKGEPDDFEEPRLSLEEQKLLDSFDGESQELFDAYVAISDLAAEFSDGAVGDELDAVITANAILVTYLKLHPEHETYFKSWLDKAGLILTFSFLRSLSLDDPAIDAVLYYSGADKRQDYLHSQISDLEFMTAGLLNRESLN